MQGLNKIVKKTLSNGVKVYFYKDSSLKRIFMTYNINYVGRTMTVDQILWFTWLL